MKQQRFRQTVTAFLLCLLAGCASLPNSTTTTLNQQHIQYALVQHHTVPVVFENGLDGRMEWWKKVIPDISKDSTTFAYNRPGYGKSDPATTPRDGQHIVDELRALLRSKGLNPPYILVGHSLGGLYMQLYARRYPEEVSALILVDSTHPRQMEGAGSLDKQPFWFRALFNVMLGATAKQELALLPQTSAQLLAYPAPAHKTVLVLSAAKPLKEKSALADDANEKRRDIARLYSGSKQVWVDSGHGIPLEKPEAVIAAIREAQAMQAESTNRADR